MIGGRKGQPGPKMIPAEAVPAVIIKASNNVTVKIILFIFFASFTILTQRIETVISILKPLDVANKLFIHSSFPHSNDSSVMNILKGYPFISSPNAFTIHERPPADKYS